MRRILHWKRVPYEIREVPPTRSLGVRRLNRIGKLPTLEDEGRVVADSTDIAHYLEQRFPDPPLLPRHPLERGLVHVLEDWADESLYFLEMTLRFGLPHGIACSFTLPMVLERAVGADPGRDAVLAQIFDGDLAGAPERLRAFLRAVGVKTEFADYGVPEEDSRRMVAHALDGVRGKNFIGARA